MKHNVEGRRDEEDQADGEETGEEDQADGEETGEKVEEMRKTRLTERRLVSVNISI